MIIIFFYSLFNFIFVSEVLMLRLQKHSNYHFFFLIRLEDALCAFKILREQLSVNPSGSFKKRRILLAVTKFGAFFSCSSNIMEAPGVALCAFKISRKLLNAHSKYCRSCSLFFHKGAQSNTIGLHDINRAAPAIF